MSVTKPIICSIFWSGMLCVTLSAGCKKASEPEKAAPEGASKSEQAESKAEQAKAGAATPTEPSGAAEAVVVEEKSSQAMTDELATLLVDEGRRVAQAIDSAVGALDDNRLDKAKTELAKAADGLTKISASRPTVDIAVELWRKNKQLDAAEVEGAVDTIPLLATVTRVDVPVYDRQAVEARYTKRKQQSPEAITKSDKASDLAFVDSNLVYLEVDMPIAATKLEVDEAQRLLDEGKSDEAKAALKRAVASFDVITVITEAPEYQARLLVWAAENAFADGDMAEAARLLGKASDTLAPLAKREDDSQSQVMVTMLMTELKPLQEALRSGNVEESKGLRQFVRNVSAYSRRMALRSMMKHHRRVEHRALADALMWLEKAESEGVSKGEGGALATSDLERAVTVLAKAKDSAPPSAASNFADLHNRVEHIAELNRAPQRDPEAIEVLLHGVMFDLHMLMLEIGASPVEREKKGVG
jgi:hypothetical protein